jgi:hypothetical protein
MADERALAAIGRIERALARIEAAASRPTPPPQASVTDSPEFTELREAHRALRSHVEGAIGQIDRLLETEAR